MAGKAPFKPRLIGEYEFDECASAINKCIRRGQEYEACYWASIIHQSGYGQYLWRRLSVICAEDIGNADINATLLLHALRSGWEAMHKHTKEHTAAQLALALQAVQYMCHCKKVRDVDALRNLILKRYEHGIRLEIDPIAKDCHTMAGKKVWGRFGDKDGRERERLEKFYNEGAWLANPAYENKWLKPLQELEEKLLKEEEAVK